MSETTKQCISCCQTKAVREFFPSKASQDGLHDSCIPCAKASWRAKSAERDARTAANGPRPKLVKRRPQRLLAGRCDRISGRSA